MKATAPPNEGEKKRKSREGAEEGAALTRSKDRKDVSRKRAKISEDASPSKRSDEEVDPSQLVHESVAKLTGKGKSTRKSKHVPENETADQRDLRTVFVGNLSVEVARKRVRVIFFVRLLL